jgi:serine/threonine-protein kinase
MVDEKWQKVREIFDSALRRKPEERQNYIIEVCGEDKTLLTEVESLLSSLDSADSFMETPAVAKVAEVIEAGIKKLERGKCFGHYEIIEQIGTGGMGEVYLAKDKKLDRKVAVKILNENFSKHEANLNRFIREAKSASALNHPNILVVHEVGAEGDAHFIVSEFIKGKTLRERLKESPPQIAEVLDIAIQTANALSAAHEAHLVHRDIKPENIMIRPDGFVKVLDFGLAKLVEQKNKTFLGLEDSTAQQNQTAKGVILGTINYMSPEQTRGKDVDARTDIWSLGVVLYEMLAGKTPFAGETSSDTISAILSKNPAPIALSIPKELERIIGKTLRKNREERYQHIKDLLIDLKDLKRELEFNEILERSTAPSANNETAIAAIAQTAQTTSSAEYIFGELKQHKRGVLAVLAILLVSAMGLSYWFFFHRPAKQIESIAVLPFINESGNADIEYLSDGMTETLINSLSQLPNLNVKARSSVFRYKGKETNPQIIGKELNVQAIINGRVVQRGEQLTLSLELVDAQTENVIWSERYNRKTADLVSLQTEIARDVSGKLRMKLSGADEQKLAKNYTVNTEAYQLYLRGNFHVEKRTEKEIRKGIEYLEKAISIDPNYALAYTGLASAYVALPNYSKVQWSEVLPKIKDATSKALSLDNDLSEAHTLLGLIISTDGDDAGAEREYQRAIELNPKSAMAYHFYSNLLRFQDKLEEAVDKQRRAVELEPLSLIINREYGSKLFFARRYDEAITQFKKTIELDASFPSAHYGLALVYWMKGNYAEAVEEHAKHQELNGEPNKAALLRESFAKGGWQGFLRTITDESQKFDLSWDNLTTYYAALGENDKAFELLNKRFENRENRKIRPGALVDPRLDPLRGDPRFQELVKRVESK